MCLSDVCKPQVKEEPLFTDLTIDIRLKAYLHWLWHGGQPPKVDPSEQQQSRRQSTVTQDNTYTPAVSHHSGRSGRGSNRNRGQLTSQMLENITASSMQSGGGRSIRSVRSDVSVHSAASNASNISNRSHHSSDGRGDLGPVLMIDILVTKHIDFRLSCYQLSMVSKLSKTKYLVACYLKSYEYSGC